MESNVSGVKAGTVAVVDDKQYYVKLPVWKKAAFGLIDTANNFSWSYISSFLMIYLTDVFLIPAAAVSTMFLVCRFWDAVNDPIVGYLADRTHSKWGRYRPWIFFGSAPLFITSALLFWPHPEWALSAKLVYIYVLYALVVLFYTMVNLTYGALNSVITQDPGERGSIASYRLTFAFIGSTIMTQLVVRVEPMISARWENMGWFVLAVIFAVFCIPLQIWGAAVQKEVVPPSERKVKLGFFQQFVMSFKNIPFMMVCVMFLAQGFSNYGVSAINVYWFKYVLGDQTPLATLGLITLPASLAGAFTAQWWNNRFRSKGKSIAVTYVAQIVLCMAQWFMFRNSNISIVWVYIMGFINGYFAAWNFSTIYGMVPDTIEYSELISKGHRMDGFLNTLSSFWNKVGITLGTAGAGWILAAVGYVANAEVQAASVVSSLHLMKFVMPSVFNLLALVCLFWYKLDYDRFDKLVAELNEKRPIWHAEEEAMFKNAK